jgi:archaellum component FlaG (FlaF/FlaG flagellin family)
MAGQAASELIFFVGAVLVSAALVGVFFAAVSEVSDSILENADASASALQSAVKVLNDPTHVSYNNTTQNFTLWVENLGARSLSANLTVVLLDNLTFANTGYTWVLAGNFTTWGPQVVAVYTLNNVNLTAGTDHFLKVIAQHGASDSQEFFW